MRPDDFIAANRLLALSLDRSSRPGTDPDHRDLLGRFRTDPGYASAVRQAAEPLGLRVLGADPQLGLVLDTTADSPFSLRSDDLPRVQVVVGERTHHLWRRARGHRDVLLSDCPFVQ